ncbi:hypothetical protein [Chitinophaga arvensicola]|uniref:Uncharacterized protein n=1 Tax=Chitinophaga arvensicola TaxID=29529 RepID=A0A1I0PP63_9BACT|nr:hypothetical protein [Chitinophaga arvensicola]SEW16123.1 hypothetical protein SAMN04488122_0892 [Chitinophaga arvensicola]
MLLSFLGSVSWLQFWIVFGIAALVWGVYVYKDVLLGKSPPEEEEQASKRIWSVQEVEKAPTVQQSLLNDDEAPVVDDEEQTDEEVEESDTEAEFEDGVFDDLEALAEKINEIFTNNVAVEDKEQLITLLKPEVSRFTSLNRLPFKVAIHNLIERQAQQNYNITLTKAETDTLWLA